MDLSQNVVALIWLILAIVLFVAEFIIPGVILAFFGIGAIVVAFLVWLGVLTTVTSQVLVFAAVSLVTLVLLRRYFSKTLKGRVQATGEYDESAEFHAAIVKVSKAIAPGSTNGRVFFQGSEWSAVSDVPIAEGENAEIIRKKNITLHVKPVENKE